MSGLCAITFSAFSDMIRLQGVKVRWVIVLSFDPLKTFMSRNDSDIRVPANDVGSRKKTIVSLGGFHEEIRQFYRILDGHRWGHEC
jgi:hypothetical protein